MGRSALVLLLTLVLGAFVAAHADVYNYDQLTAYPEGESDEKWCSRKQPFRYPTWKCPTCKRNDHCVKTECNEAYDGKAKVTIDLKCLFPGGKIGFVAVSYKDGKDKDGKDIYKCENNQNGRKYDKYIYLSNLKCEDLSKSKLRFIVQNKWWYNPEGKDLEISDSCYDKCTHGKPCHTCEFPNVDIPECKNYCKKPMCDHTHKKDCPEQKEMDDCFEYQSHKNHVQVKFKEECHHKMKHVACSYHDKGEKKFTHHEYSDKSDKDRYFSFDAPCNAGMKWYFEDDYWNKDAPKCPSQGDSCYEYFKYGNYCNQCGPYHPVHVPDCKKDGKND